MGTRDWAEKPPAPRTGPREVHDVPEFRWPHRVTELTFECLSTLWESLSDYAADQIRNQTLLGRVQVLIALAVTAYLALLWVCLCYIRFPISPFGVWDLVEWAITAGSVVWGAIGVYFSGVTLLALLWVLLVIVIYLTVSLGYLCWTVWNAALKQSPWLGRYVPVMMFGMTASVAAATYAEGAYRFWEPPSTAARWMAFAAVGVSGWAALFCYLMRDSVQQRETPRRIIKWTAGLIVVIAMLIHWHAGQGRTAHSLEKETGEHPNDPNAWLDLARYYKDQADTLAADSGHEDHAPPNPKPYYEDALHSMNRAVELGAGGFEVNFSRAQVADALGNARAAIAFAQEALKFAPGESTPEGKDQITWLNDMIARNKNSLAALQEEEQRLQERQRARDRRRQHLPWVVRWIFDSDK